MFLAGLAVAASVSVQAQSPIPDKLPPYSTPQASGEFLARMLAVAKHNDLTDVAFTQSVFGPGVKTDSDGHQDMHPIADLDLIGNGPGAIAAPGMDYFYALSSMKSAMNLWHDDPLFMGEFGIHGIDKYMCINGRDISNVFRADSNVGLVSPGSHTFHVSQAANSVTLIDVDGPVEDDQKGCIRGITITQKRMSEFVPSAAGGQ